MSEDIVERLRRRKDHGALIPGPDELCQEAADEIERLRVEVERKQESIEWLKPFAARGLGDAFEDEDAELQQAP